MNIDQFKKTFQHLRDVDPLEVDALCDHPNHVKLGKPIAKGPAKRNILKHGGEKFICRECHMKYDNPMNHVGEGRQTDEEIVVYCPHPDHEGDPARVMKKACYFGTMEEPYLQTCKSCAQLGKEIPEEQREKIRQALKGIERSDEFKEKLSEYMKNNPEGVARGKANLIPGVGGGWNKGLSMPEDVKEKMSKSHTGKIFSDEHCQHISEGRKKMLEETGGFTKEHRENLSKAAARQYARGFDPQLHHRRGWHESSKAGKVFYRSSYEKKAYLLLDEDDNVQTYRCEYVHVSFFNPVKKIEGTYLVDILVEYVDGTEVLVEVKPECWLSDTVIQAKLDAAKLVAEGIGAKFEVWTEVSLFGPVYNEKNIRAFVESIDSNYKANRKAGNRKRAKKHYDEKISQDKVEVWCEFCQNTHFVLRKSYEPNIARNGRFICEREGGHIAGSLPKKKKPNPHAADGKKECTKCGQVKPFEDFGLDKSRSDGYATRCKECRNEHKK